MRNIRLFSALLFVLCLAIPAISFAGTSSISSLSPTSGPVGTVVTINGSDFKISQGGRIVTFNGVSATITSWSTTQITAIVPPGATTGNVIVSMGQKDSNGVLFTVTPSISSLLPTFGSAGMSVTVDGSTFGSSVGSITFNGTVAAAIAWSTTEIVAIVPVAATTGSVIVTTADGLVSNAIMFSVAPTISSLSPTSAPAGASITIVGFGFGPVQGSSTVTFNGLPAIPNSWTATQIVVPVPGDAISGTVVVSVGGVPSNGANFTVLPTPSINTVFPSFGPVGTSVTITGSNFGTAQGSSTVIFGGTAVTATAWTATSIAALVPDGLTPGSAGVTVTVSAVPSNPSSFVVTPQIVSLAPASAPVGGLVTVAGSNFGATQGTSTLNFNGIVASPLSWSATQIIAPVPQGATTGSVSVTVNNTASNSTKFNLLPTPSIITLSPASGPVGASITVTGSNFGATQASNTISFNGMPAIPISWSDTQIVSLVPSGATSGTVVVTANRVPSSSSGPIFTVLPTPRIDGLFPSSGPVGASVILSGSNFGSAQGNSTLTFGGLAVAAKAWSDSSITAEIPSDLAAGPAGVAVTVNGVSSDASSFVVTPRIIEVSPLSAPAGASVTITGSTFGGIQGTSTVTFNGIVATPSSWTATQIVVPVPVGADTGNLVVTVNNAASNTLSFAVLPTPVISNLSPAAGPLGATITIVGSSFGAAQVNSTITFNGTPAIVSSWSDTQIVASVPGTATTGTVVVTVNGVPSSSSGPSFTVLPTPSVTSLSPLSGPLGISVVLTGTDFGSSQGTSTVTFGNTIAAVSSWTDTSIAVIVPNGLAPGGTSVAVTVTGVGSKDSSFTVTPLLTVLSPASGIVGAAITIAGSNFGLTQGSSTVTFNALSCTVLSWSPTEIVVLVPGSSATGSVVVTVNNTPSNALNFTAIQPPVISSITPASAVIGARVNITGSNFGAVQGSGLVMIGGVAAVVVSWSDTQVVAAIGAGATTGSVAISQNGISSNSVPITIMTPFVRGRLEMTRFSNPPDYNTIDLSDPEVIDWVHWGLSGNTGVDRRSGVNLISDLTIIGGHSPFQYTSCFDDFSWSNGNARTSDIDACSGLFLWNLGDGFQITVPADNTAKTLKLYVGAEFGTAQLSASLSDNSASAYVDTGMLTDGSAAGTYSIDFQAASPGQTLTVTYIFGDSVGGDITIEAAALAPKHPDVMITQPAAEQSFTAPAAFTASLQASQSNVSISSVSLLQDNNLLLTVSDSLLDFPVTNLPAGNYFFTAQATDSNGLSQTSQPVPVHVVGDGGELVASVAASPASVDLTSQGTADWALLGRLNGNWVDRKANVFPLIGDISRVNWAYWYGFLDNAITYSAEDGTQAFAPVNAGVYSPNPGSGFEFNVGAGLTERTLNVYVGTYRGQGQFEAYLSDGSAAPYFDSSTDSGSQNGVNQVYSLRYHAASEGQKLTIRYTLLNNHNYGNVTLQAITVDGPPRQ